MKKIINLIYEAAAVNRVHRTGWQILGDHEEKLGNHVFMTAVIAYFLGRLLKANMETILVMSIFHDFHEARTGDVDKLNKLYVTRHEARANKDIFEGIDDELLQTLDIYEKKESFEARIVYEANVVALLVELKLLIEKGNIHAQEWFESNSKRLKIKEAIVLAQELARADSQDWWKDIRATIKKEFTQ